MFRKPENAEPDTEEKKASRLSGLDNVNWYKVLKVLGVGISLVFNMVLTVAFIYMFNPLFLLFALSMYINARYLKIVLLEKWLVY